MNNRFEILQTNENLIILFNKKNKLIADIGLIIIGGLILIFSLYVFIEFIAKIKQEGFEVLPIIIVLAYIFLVLIVGKNIMTSAFLNERIEATRENLTIINKNLFVTKKEIYDVEKIQHVNYVGYTKDTEHPIGSPNVDFTGLAEREKIVSYLNTEGNIEFLYNNAFVRFGKNIPSWDAEVIFKNLKDFYNQKIDIAYIESENEIDYKVDEN